MIGNNRQLKILEILGNRGNITVDELASMLKVSKMTIRRDLEKLQESNLLQRTHGGAFINKTLIRELTYHEKRLENQSVKECIAGEVLRFVKPKMTIYVDAGTTTYEVATRLPQKELTIITNDIRIASQMMLTENTCIFLGGVVMKETGSSTDFHAIDMLDNFNIDLAIMATSSIDSDLNLCTPEQGRQLIKRKAMENSDKRILVTDSTKFFSKSLYRICNLSDFDVVITDFPKDKLDVHKLETVEFVGVSCGIMGGK
ncbi:MAG: DeoR/GlpR family DNA-binding transcription regulator [Acholeplasmataceae bacterium]|nr:DeoR/GlpR family DNA-binding transcription regulator [Acholeplasmataceae bacterium]MDD4193655.1 DeoR/GlpR family DNA-binding transcription regulator [Acholeplasmataceae bacterium]